MRTTLAFILFAVFLSCSGNPPQKLRPEEKRLAAAYAELYALKERLSVSESVFQDSARAVLKRLDFSKDDYDRALTSLNKVPERWMVFYREVQVQLSANKSSGAVRR
jgi:hypothetical protein